MATMNEIARALATGKRMNELVQGASYPWLAPFAIPFEERVKLAFTPAVTAGPVPYDPRTVDQLLDSLTKVIDRCLSHQRDAAELEAAAVLQAIEYQLARLQRRFCPPRERHGFLDLLLCALGRAPRPNPEDALLQAYQESLESRHVSPNGALNFEERIARLIDHSFEPDLREAYLKARAVEEGLASVYGLTVPPLPAPDSPALLDALAAYARNASNLVEQCRRDEVEFEHMIPIRDLIDDPSAYHSAMDPWGNGLLSFDLSKYFPDTLQRLRVRGLGASYAVNDDRQIGWWRLQQVSVIVFPPKIPPRPPVFLSAVSITDPSQPVRMSLPTALDNMDPRGVWQVKVSPNVRFAHLDPQPRTEANIRDVRLHLSLRARADFDAHNWTGFDW